MVPWDIPGVTGTPISGGRTSRIFPTSVSSHMGSIQLPWHSGMLGTSRKSETDLQLGVEEMYLSHFSQPCNQKAFGDFLDSNVKADECV